jgi:hypothetical protein
VTIKEQNQNSKDMIYLIACVLHGTEPEREKVMQMDLQQLYQVSRFHSLTSLVCMALENTELFQTSSSEMQKKWKDEKNKSIRKNLLLDVERNKLFDWMNQNKIWHMPLKGSLLKEMYPKAGMRQMADNDILFDQAFQYPVKEYMESQGYRVVSVGKGNHDVYEKPPVYNFELHTALFGGEQDSVLIDYYEKVKERLLPDAPGLFGYHFSAEDFYIYLLAHAYKHFAGSGTGLRSLVDVSVYLAAKKDTLDWKYIRTEIETLQLTKFEAMCRKLSEKLFSHPTKNSSVELTEEEEQQVSYLIGSGTYGTTLNSVRKKMEQLQSDGTAFRQTTRLHYYWNRMFPNKVWIQTYAPFCDKHKWFLPFFLLFRVVRGVLFRRKKLVGELRAVRKIMEIEQ